jgi:hypothetical protein
VSTVLAASTGPGPTGGAAGSRALPNTGQGNNHDTANWLVAIAALVAAAGGLAGAAAIRQRRR